jgi:hypothetical protein
MEGWMDGYHGGFLGNRVGVFDLCGSTSYITADAIYIYYQEKLSIRN